MKRVKENSLMNEREKAAMKVFYRNFLIFKHTRSGFTLIEIMVVLFILAILAAIVAPRLVGRTDDARVAQAKVQIKNFDTALKLFKMDNAFYPSTEQGLEALINEPATGRIPKNYKEGGYLDKKKIVLDPWGNDYVYISPGIQGDYDIISYGADEIPGGEGYDADITNWDL
jgi:general secretion pathway protein G